MTPRSPIVRAAAVLSSTTLLAAYVWHSHVTPNTPPPDPLGLSTIELKLEPETVEFDGFVKYREPVPAANPKREELRIITSKSISQPIFSVRKIRPSRPWMLPGSKSPVLEFEMDSFYLNLDLPSFDLFGEQLPTKPRP